MNASGNTLLITGGGSGIGRELALRFHALGNTVIVTGRHLDTLQETISGREGMHAMTLDMADPDAIREFAREITGRFAALNGVINNAGIMRIDDVGRESDLADAEAQVVTNLLGPIRLNNALVEHLKRQQNGFIVNVSSGLAFVPRADAAVYGATKAGIHLYTQALRHQLAGQVRVIELAPPAVQTELTPGQAHREGYMPLDAFIDEVMALFTQQPVADEIIVERARFQRLAEREGRFDEAFLRINGGS
ncbi:SDR family oxidoreductase [Pseudomonas sp. sia0905]|uniref:SDR family oxidoreductase n=1 Tax=Pseudomonas sp. sia0905 TaxID=2854783 RepID=UPI001C45A8A8|nr:SDR family oxidoreductase [Pseudomonas sp. sia0905]MBV7564363.1 SDR family oxidoreductase [Pseudomonas sp. sia0905]